MYKQSYRIFNSKDEFVFRVEGFDTIENGENLLWDPRHIFLIGECSGKLQVLLQQQLIYGEQFRYSRKIQENRETYHYTTIDIVNTGNRKIVVQQLGVELPDGFRYNLNEDIEFDRPLCCFPIELEPEQFIKCLWLNDDFRDLLVTRHLHENNKRITFYIQDSAGIYYKRKTTKTPKQFLEEN